jgi:ATP phosphoribosyltransferase regulatory subunit HisZ
LKRRHMHMSDSESDEDERLESIFRKKNQKGAREKSPEKSEEEQEEEDESLGEGRGGRGMTWRAEQHSREEEEQEEEEEGGESVVSVSKEKLKYLEREKYIQRGLLHHLADDSEDED